MKKKKKKKNFTSFDQPCKPITCGVTQCCLSVMQHSRARRSLCERLKPYSLPAGHAACQEGDESDTMWLLTEGKQIRHCTPVLLINMIMVQPTFAVGH